VGRYIVVGVTSCHWLDGPGIESRRRRDFPQPSRPTVESKLPSIQWAPCLSRGVKQPKRSVNHPPISSVEVKERIGLYLYAACVCTWPVLGRTLPLSLLLFTFSVSVHTVALLVEALRYKSEGRGFDSRWCHSNFSLT